MKYVVGENCAGYLPVSEPVVFSEEEGRDAAIEYFLKRLNELYPPHSRPTHEEVAHGIAVNEGYSLKFTTPEGQDMEVWITVED